jgi:hypothetical protein
VDKVGVAAACGGSIVGMVGGQPRQQIPLGIHTLARRNLWVLPM